MRFACTASLLVLFAACTGTPPRSSRIVHASLLAVNATSAGAFDALPVRAKDAVYRRMWEILSGQATADRYTRLTLDDRRAVVEILRDTKPDLPAYFQGAVH